MFNEIIRGRRDTLRARLQAETGDPLALLILVGAAWLSFMIYVLIFVQPLALVSFWQYNQVNLYSFSHLYPYLRFALVAAPPLHFWRRPPQSNYPPDSVLDPD